MNADTVLFSPIKSEEQIDQMLIPPELITSIVFNAACLQVGADGSADFAAQYGNADWGISSIPAIKMVTK